MSDDTADAIREVTALLRERIGQSERMLALQGEYTANVRAQREHAAGLMERFRNEQPKIELPELPEYDAAQQRQKLDEIVLQGERERAEQRAFRERLLSEMARHTELLERIATRIEAQ
jgi:hypothetical protein